MPSAKCQVLNAKFKESLMSSTAQTKNGNTNLGFTTVQAYTLAVITLAIGIAVGYFARGSASARACPHSRSNRS